MHYCLKCPGPLPDDYGGRCPYCGSMRIVEAEYESVSGKWYPIESYTGRFGREHYRWIEGDWDRLEAEREQRELDDEIGDYLPDFEYYDDDSYEEYEGWGKDIDDDEDDDFWGDELEDEEEWL